MSLSTRIALCTSLHKLGIEPAEDHQETKVLNETANRAFKSLKTYLFYAKGDAWFTTYLVTFMLLHKSPSRSWTSPDETPAQFVEQRQRCALTPLANWQFFQRHAMKEMNSNA